MRTLILVVALTMFACDNAMQAGEPSSEQQTNGEVTGSEKAEGDEGEATTNDSAPVVIAGAENGSAPESTSTAKATGSPSSTQQTEKPSVGPKRIFVTRAKFTGDIVQQAKTADAISGGDIICDRIARGQKLGGRWIVWLSNGDTSAIDRVPEDAGPWHAVTGTSALGAKIFDNKYQILSGPLERFTTDEFGVSITDDGEVWTGTTGAGHRADRDCAEFMAETSGGSDYFGEYGQLGTFGSAWTTVGAARCSERKHLYCFEI